MEGAAARSWPPTSGFLNLPNPLTTSRNNYQQFGAPLFKFSNDLVVPWSRTGLGRGRGGGEGGKEKRSWS